MRCKSWLKWSGAIPIAIVAATLSAPMSRAEQLLWFDFNDASDPTVAVDSSGKGNDGILEGAIYSAPGGGISGAAADRAMDLGDFNNGAYLDLIDIAQDGAFDTLVDNDQATIAFWLNGNDQQPVSQWTFWFGPDRQLGSHAPWGDGTIYFDVAGCCGANTRIAKNIPDPSLYSGQWNHFAYVKDVTYTAIYLNGELFHDSGDDEKDPLFDITEAAFGADAAGTSSHGGMMDDVGVWDEALDEAAIQALMGLAPPTYVGGRGTIGIQAYEGVRSNEMLGPEQSGVSGWTGRIVTFDEHGLTIGSQTVADEVLEDFDGVTAIGAYSVVDMAGGGGTFPTNLPYPNGVEDASQDDFAVEVTSEVTIPAGTWTIGFGSDDGGQITIPGVEFLIASDPNDSFDDDQIRYEVPRGHGWTVGSFTLDEPLETTIIASFYERGGGDSFEIAIIEDEVIEAANADDWDLLGDGTLGWSVKTTAAPLLSADLSAEVAAGRPLEFDVDGDTGMADQLVVDNPDPNVFTTMLDVDGVTFQIASAGAVTSGEAFTIIDADQVMGTPIITSLDPGQTWVFDGATGRLCLDSCPGVGGAGDYNGNGLLDADDLDLHASVGIATQDLAYDANGDGLVNVDDRVVWTNDLKNTWMGDSDLNGVFDTADFVIVFGEGKYETGGAATWGQGDWNGDMLFDSGDFVAAFGNGGYEMGERAGGPNPVTATVPEPSSLVLALLSLVGLVGFGRRRNA